MEELYYSKNHMWVKVEGDIARIGITHQYIDERFSEVGYVDLPEEEDTVEAGEPFGEVELDEEVFELVAPVTGVVVRVNEALLDDPEVLLTDPLGEGWLIEVALENAEEIGNLLSEEEYEEMLEEEELEEEFEEAEEEEEE